MDKESVATALRDLGNSESRSETARLREVFPEIEAALEAGVSRNAILETLHEQGFKMTLKSFESALYRLRKKALAGKDKTPNHVSFPPAPPRPLVGENLTLEPGSKTDEEINALPLTARERREKRADQFIKPASLNPILKNLKDRVKK